MRQQKTKGFVFSLEAAISMMLLGLMLLTLAQPHAISLKELSVLQQENDLLRVWSAQYPTQAEITADTQALFGGNADVFVGSAQIVKANAAVQKNNSIATEGILLDNSLQEVKARIITYLE